MRPAPTRPMRRAAMLSLGAATLTACSEIARLPESAGFGPRPALPEPVRGTLPTVNIAPAIRWTDGGQPTAPEGLRVTAFARELDHPRWLHVLPNGDVLVAESNAPVRPGRKGLRNWIMGKVMQRAGAGSPSANRLTLLRDRDGDGIAETRSVFATGLNSPFGLALIGEHLYIANTDAIVRARYRTGDTTLAGPVEKLTDLPAGDFNHHWTKNIIASPDGRKLYATVGSNSNVAENGLVMEEGRAAIWEVDVATGSKRLFATGLRNPNGMAWEPSTHTLWTVVNERDELGSDLVPDYLTSVRDGGFYGWPYSYFGATVDERVKPPRPDLVARAIVPDYALGAHTASLGLAFSGRNALPARFHDGMFIGQHGSWNRRPHSGYKVIFVPFRDGRPDGEPRDVLTGFLTDEGRARGRPVGVELDRKGALLVADDVGNVVWRVTGAGG